MIVLREFENGLNIQRRVSSLSSFPHRQHVLDKHYIQNFSQMLDAIMLCTDLLKVNIRLFGRKHRNFI